MVLEQNLRPRFYEGQYLGARDMNAAIDYWRHQQARHLLGGHTWGIVAGLQLTEKETFVEGVVDVYLQPGMAWDGFGRLIVVPKAERLSTEEFMAIKYNASLDGGDPPGRLVEVWLRYDESETGTALPGYELCTDEDQNNRIREVYQIEIGRRTAHNTGDYPQHSSIDLAGRSVDAQNAERALSPKASLIYDESIPYQTLPDRQDKAHWYIPLGYVRWVPNTDVTQAGHFTPMKAKSREASMKLRRYMGVVATYIQTENGHIRLRDRRVDPAQSPDSDDLVWIEGDLRVDEDAKMFGGSLQFRTNEGETNGVPLQVSRREDNTIAHPSAPGLQNGRDLQVQIGSEEDGQNRLTVGPVIAKASAEGEDSSGEFKLAFCVRDDGSVGVGSETPSKPLVVRAQRDSQELVAFEDQDGVVKWHINQNLGGDKPGLNFVESGLKDGRLFLQHGTNQGGRVGINNTVPERTLHILGDRIRLEDPNAERRLDLRADGSHVDIESSTSKVFLHSSAPDGNNQVIISPYGENSRVGIGTTNPERKLHVVGDRIRLQQGARKLDLRADGSHVDIQSTTSKIFLHSTAGGGDNDVIINPYGTNGNVGIGTTNPEKKLHVVGDRIRLENAGKELDLRADGSQIDIQSSTHNLFIHTSGPNNRNHIFLNPYGTNGNVGVGTTNPVTKLHVIGDQNGNANDLDAHVALIENENSGTSADVLALKVASNAPGGANNFITFFSGNDVIGAIEGNGSTITHNFSGADYAEWLPRQDTEEKMAAGDIVAIIGGKVTKKTSAADQLQVISTAPLILGNRPKDAERSDYAPVAFLGQVPIRVQGVVRKGDFVLASGKDDGIGIAVHPEKIAPQDYPHIVGRAWEASEEEEAKLVNCVVGVPGAYPWHALSRWMLDLQTEMKQLRALVGGTQPA